MSTNQMDFGNIIRSVYDPSTQSLNINIVGSGSPTVPNVVRLSDGVGYLTTTVSGSYRALDTNIVSMPELQINQNYDSIAIGDGTNLITSTALAGKQGLDVNVLNSEPPVEYITLVDSTVSGITYVGQALPATTTSQAYWQIQKIVSSSGNTSVLYANGSDAFNSIWNNRTSLVYS